MAARILAIGGAMTPDRRRFRLARMAWAPVLRALAAALPFALTLVVTTPADGNGTRPPVRLAAMAPRASAAHPAAAARRASAARPASVARPAPGPAWAASALPLMGTGRAFAGSPAIGALFDTGGSAPLGNHFCSASVVDSASGNLVLTAAHCLDGMTVGQVSFVPGYHDGHAPYGVWAVTRIVTDPRWAASSDPDGDFAFLQVSPPASGQGGQDGVWAARLQDLTGGEFLGGGEPAGGLVTVVGYPSSGDAPIFCRNRVRPFGGTQLEFDCSGYAEGTSGGPLLTDVNPATGLGTVVGVIGGYHRGGSTSDVSYADRFGGAVAALFQTVAGSGAGVAPAGGAGLSTRPVAGLVR
jgi:V8-like Glu-specific endopeptidase